MNLKDEPDLGYIFFPEPYENAIGHSRFDVVMHTQPTDRHFDPINATFWTSRRDKIEHLTIHHPWHTDHPYKVMAGRIIVRDRSKKEVEAFTFGANLQISSDKNQTVCVFTSPAPILFLVSLQSIETDFSDEVEGFLARQKARYGREYKTRLATIDPMRLYIACLEAIQEKFAHLPIPHTGERHHFQQWIPEELERLKLAGKRPLLTKTIDDLFAG